MRRLPEASWKSIDVVVETVTEDLELKRRLFAEMETLPTRLRHHLELVELPDQRDAKDLKTQGRMMGLHFFMPAHLIPLVEVVRSVHTDVKQAERLARSCARWASGRCRSRRT
jgi:3-hydroxybutyryl-CoA dehydrogenase